MCVCVYLCMYAADREEVGDSGGDPSRPFAAVATREQTRDDYDVMMTIMMTMTMTTMMTAAVEPKFSENALFSRRTGRHRTGAGAGEEPFERDATTTTATTATIATAAAGNNRSRTG